MFRFSHVVGGAVGFISALLAVVAFRQFNLAPYLGLEEAVFTSKSDCFVASTTPEAPGKVKGREQPLLRSRVGWPTPILNYDNADTPDGTPAVEPFQIEASSTSTTTQRTTTNASSVVKIRKVEELSRVVTSSMVFNITSPNSTPTTMASFYEQTWRKATLPPVDEPVDAVWDKELAEKIKDYGDRDLCEKHPEPMYLEFPQILRTWHELTTALNVPYVLIYGSTLAYLRDKNITPYDSDVDVVIPAEAFRILERYASVRPIRWRDPIHLVVHPQFEDLPPDARTRFDCSNKVVKSMVDSCSFLSPIARMFGARNWRYVDVFAFYEHPDGTTYTSYGPYLTLPVNAMFPARPCTFVGVKMWCPNDPVLLSRIHYGPGLKELRPSWVCDPMKKKWVRRKNLEGYEKRWSERFGDVDFDSPVPSTRYVGDKLFCSDSILKSMAPKVCGFFEKNVDYKKTRIR